MDGTSLTRGDSLIGPPEAPFWAPGAAVVAGEKLDGANLGLSLSSSYQPRAQCRGRSVDATSAPQFRGPPAWQDENLPALASLLAPGGREVSACRVIPMLMAYINTHLLLTC